MIYSFVKTVGALLNTMIGSAIVILPIKFIENGAILSIIIVIITALCTCYSNLICIQHMDDH